MKSVNVVTQSWKKWTSLWVYVAIAFLPGCGEKHVGGGNLTQSSSPSGAKNILFVGLDAEDGGSDTVVLLSLTPNGAYPAYISILQRDTPSHCGGKIADLFRGEKTKDHVARFQDCIRRDFYARFRHFETVTSSVPPTSATEEDFRIDAMVYVNFRQLESILSTVKDEVRNWGKTAGSVILDVLGIPRLLNRTKRLLEFLDIQQGLVDEAIQVHNQSAEVQANPSHTIAAGSVNAIQCVVFKGRFRQRPKSSRLDIIRSARWYLEDFCLGHVPESSQAGIQRAFNGGLFLAESLGYLALVRHWASNTYRQLFGKLYEETGKTKTFEAFEDILWNTSDGANAFDWKGKAHPPIPITIFGFQGVEKGFVSYVGGQKIVKNNGLHGVVQSIITPADNDVDGVASQCRSFTVGGQQVSESYFGRVPFILPRPPAVTGGPLFSESEHNRDCNNVYSSFRAREAGAAPSRAKTMETQTSRATVSRTDSTSADETPVSTADSVSSINRISCNDMPRQVVLRDTQGYQSCQSSDLSETIRACGKMVTRTNTPVYFDPYLAYRVDPDIGGGIKKNAAVTRLITCDVGRNFFRQPKRASLVCIESGHYRGNRVWVPYDQLKLACP